MKYLVVILALLASTGTAMAECYYTDGVTHCCWTHVNGKDKVCN